MAPKEVALHTQDLVDVMFELDDYKDPRFVKAFQMANRGDLYQLNEENLEGLRGDIFGEDIWDSPILSGNEDLPLTDLPTPAQVQRIMMLEIGGQNNFRFAPSRGTLSLDAYATKKLLENITDLTYSERGAIIHAECPILDNLRTKTTAWQKDGLLGQTDFQVTIAPASDFFDMKLYDNYRFTTLLSGTQVTIAYPPSLPNVAALQACYKELSGTNSGPIWHNVRLEHGIAIVQKPGETLMLPPFWPSAVFCTETSVSAAYSIATAVKYTQRFDHVGLYIAQLRMWPDKSQEQKELIKYADSLAIHLYLILDKKKLPRFDEKAVVIDICRNWDSEMKVKLGEILAAIDDEAERARICESVTQTWIEFVNLKRDKKPVCRLCKARLEKVKGFQRPDQNLVDHVTVNHCIVMAQE